MAPRQRRVVELLERDPPERDVDPEVVAAPLEREPEGVAGRLDVPLAPELHPFLVVELHLGDAARVDELEVGAAEPVQAQAARASWPVAASAAGPGPGRPSTRGRSRRTLGHRSLVPRRAIVARPLRATSPATTRHPLQHARRRVRRRSEGRGEPEQEERRRRIDRQAGIVAAEQGQPLAHRLDPAAADRDAVRRGWGSRTS